MPNMLTDWWGGSEAEYCPYCGNQTNGLLERSKFWVLERLPAWLRHHGPLKKYYWQPEQIEQAKAAAEELQKNIRWK